MAIFPDIRDRLYFLPCQEQKSLRLIRHFIHDTTLEPIHKLSKIQKNEWILYRPTPAPLQRGEYRYSCLPAGMAFF
jgi:hypothetical protein